VDQSEAKRRRAADKPKLSKRHPYAAVDHRVLDSLPYSDMTFSAHSLLLLMARQLTKDNNGHLQASFTWCKRYGFGSEHTVRAAIAELLSHGFIYRTRSHGANGAWAKYAVTWLLITKRDGLFLDAFRTCAWRDWQPNEKKSSRQKLPEESGRKCSFTPENPAESAGNPPAKTADYELIPCRGAVDLGVDLLQGGGSRKCLQEMAGARMNGTANCCQTQAGAAGPLTVSEAHRTMRRHPSPQVGFSSVRAVCVGECLLLLEKQSKEIKCGDSLNRGCKRRRTITAIPLPRQSSA